MYTYVYSYIVILMIQVGCSGWGDRFAEEELWRADQVTWNEVSEVIDQECNYCHSEPLKAGAPIPLESYAEVTHWIERIWVRVFQENDMPPGGIKNKEQYEIFLKWIEQERNAPGSTAPNDAVTSGMEAGGNDAGSIGNEGGVMAGVDAGIEDRTLTWENDILELFTIYCNNCHSNPPTGGAPFPLIEYTQAIEYLERIRIRTIEQKNMPPGGIMDEDDLQKIADWISSGAP